MTAFFTGKNGAAVADALPFPLTADVLERGQQRFNIYCSPCHGRPATGDGMIVRRGFRQPPSYHIDRLRNAPVGHFFDVMTNGFGAMPDYRAQIPPRGSLGDRRLHARAAIEPARLRRRRPGRGAAEALAAEADRGAAAPESTSANDDTARCSRPSTPTASACCGSGGSSSPAPGSALAAIGVVLRPADLMPSWLIGFLFCTGLSLGSLGLLMMQHM